MTNHGSFVHADANKPQLPKELAASGATNSIMPIASSLMLVWVLENPSIWHAIALQQLNAGITNFG